MTTEEITQRLDAKTAMVEAATGMARKGMRVFPCGADKKPLTSHGFKDASSDENVIRAWWTRWPDAGIGMPTGKINNILVLDVDQDDKKGIDGEAALQVVIDREGVTLPSTRMVRTPRGGLHVYFKYPGQTVKNSTSKIGPGLDVRGDGGYVIAPPSKNGNGKEYSVVIDGPIADLPAAFVKLIVEPVRPQAPAPAQRLDDIPDRAKVEDALRHVSANCSFDDWLRIGMALHSWSPSEGRAIWDSWSRTAPERYQEASIGQHWQTFKEKTGGVTIASLFKMALDNGWNQGGQPKVASAAINLAKGDPEGIAKQYGPALITQGKTLMVNQSHFAARYVSDSGVVHDPAVSRFYHYTPETGLWQHQTDEATVREISSCFQSIVTEKNRPRLLARRTSSLLHGLCELARGLAERRDVFNQRCDVIHVANGMLALDPVCNVEMKPFAPEWYSRNRSEIAWNPKADCPRFKRELLLSALPEEDVSLIQRYVGQCLLGMNVSQTFLILRGTPGGGKSTLANVIESVIGRHNVTELRIAQLGERFEMIRFVGRTLLSGKDVPGDFLNSKPAHVLKALVGGDTLEGEVKHGNESFSIEGRYNVLISTNTRLRVKLDSDAGAWRRRMLIVDYDKPKPPKPIPGFDSLLLREEGEGILRWAVEGAIQLNREMTANGTLQLTDTQRRRVDDLLSESDSVRSFVRECVVQCHGGEIAIHDLTTAYQDYCEAHDWDPLRDRHFQAELPDAMLEFHRTIRRNDIRQEGKAVRGFRGVRLQTCPPRPSDASESTTEIPLPDASDDHREFITCEKNIYNVISLEQSSEPSVDEKRVAILEEGSLNL